MIGQWVRQWREIGSIQVKARTRRNTVRLPENIQRVRTALERSPRRSVLQHSQLLNLSDRRVRRILQHDLHCHPYKLARAWFQQDGATAHIARLSLNTLLAAFPGRILSRFGDIQWPSNSPDLTAADLFLWGYLKAQVFTHTLPDINSLKNAIRQEIANVTQDTLRRVMASVRGRWQPFVDCHEGHFQDVLLKAGGFFGKSKTLTYLTAFSCIYCCVQ
jgi:hypothetical protein